MPQPRPENKIPKTSPAPPTMIDASKLNPIEAGRLWAAAVEAGRDCSFFCDGNFIGSTAPDSALDAWLAQ